MSEYNLLSLIHLLSTGEPYRGRSDPVGVRGVATIEELPDDGEVVCVCVYVRMHACIMYAFPFTSSPEDY